MNPGARLEAIRRLTWLGAGLLLWGAAIFAKLISLQIVHHNEYLVKAQHQQEHPMVIAAPRGTIYDAEGTTLAESIPTESVVVNPMTLLDRRAAADVLSMPLGLDKDDLYGRIERAAKKHSGFLVVKKNLSVEESQRMHLFPQSWIQYKEGSRRTYPNGTLAAHIVGSVYKGEVGEEGVEKKTETTLAGAPGSGTIQTDVKREGIDDWVDDPAVPGKELKLTIDSRLQYLAEKELAIQVPAKHARTGTVIVMDPHTGEILAFANYPTFDPNHLPRNTEERRTHFNLGAQVPFEPGSIFKVLTLATALETTNIRPETMIDCHHGVLKLPGRVVHEAHGGFGMLSMADVLAHSSNIGAIEIGSKIGREKFYEYLTNFGFGQRTGISLPAESPGILRKLNRWGTTSLASVSMGQEVAATSLQLIRACAAVANGGLLIKPKIIAEIGGKPTLTEPSRRVLRPETTLTMRSMMEGVVLHGTGRATIKLHGWTAGGKTGTAQIFENGHYTHLYNASFMGFAPVNNPALVAIVTVNGSTGNLGMGSYAAGPVWSVVMSEALRLRNVPKDLPDLPRAPSANPAKPDETNEVAEIEGATGPNILDDDPSAMPKLTDIPIAQDEDGAEVVPTGGIPKVTAENAPAGAVPASAEAAALYTGAVAPDFRGKPMRSVVREAYAKGLVIEAEGSGIARAQTPVAGAPVHPGERVRVLFAR